MKCQACGASATDTAKFCEYCGAKLIREPVCAESSRITDLAAPIETAVEETAVESCVPESEAVANAVEFNEAAEEAIPVELVESSDAAGSSEGTESSEATESPVREQAYLDYEKRLRDMRRQQTETSITAVAVTEELTEGPSSESVSDLPAEIPHTEETPLPNAVVLAGCSGMFVTANIMFTINTVLTALASVVSVILCAAGASAALSALSEFIGTDIYAYIGAMSLPITAIAGLAAVLFTNVPLLLINIGLCTTHSACQNSDGGNIRPTGLKLIRIIAVIGLILTLSVCAAGLAVSVLFIPGDSYTRAFGVALLIFSAIATIAMIFCFAKLIGTLNNVIGTAAGRFEKKASTFLGVLCIITAVFLIYNLPACLALIFYAVTLFKYNSIIRSRNS